MTSQASNSSEITDEMIDRLAHFLQTEWAGPYYARSRDFTADELAAGMLREADEAAAQKTREMARRALEAAFNG